MRSSCLPTLGAGSEAVQSARGGQEVAPKSAHSVHGPAGSSEEGTSRAVAGAGCWVEVNGFEPSTSAVRRQRSTGLSYTPRSGQGSKGVCLDRIGAMPLSGLVRRGRRPRPRAPRRAHGRPRRAMPSPLKLGRAHVLRPSATYLGVRGRPRRCRVRPRVAVRGCAVGRLAVLDREQQPDVDGEQRDERGGHGPRDAQRRHEPDQERDADRLEHEGEDLSATLPGASPVALGRSHEPHALARRHDPSTFGAVRLGLRQ